MKTNAPNAAKSIGTVNAPAPSRPEAELQLDGPCLQKTLTRIGLAPEARGAVRDQAISLLSDVVCAYERDFGHGEVGTNGAGEVLPTASPGGDESLGPTGLLYGRIQSGKTAAMIAFTALALDNGFRIVVVLTTNFVELVTQTAERFSVVARSLVHASTQRDAWESDVDNIRKHVGKRGLVIVCAKDGRHLQSVEKLINDIGGGTYPAVILDDEADQASLDNNVRKRSRSQDDIAPTRIHDQIMRLRTTLSHHVFVQVTATPFALLLQNVDHPLRPRFTRLLEPGDGYTGGEHFFSEDRLKFEGPRPEPPVIYVDEGESEELQKTDSLPPRGFEEAVTFFLVASAAQTLLEPEAGLASQNFLCHTSHKKSEHAKIDNLLRSFLSRFEDELESGAGRATSLVHWGYEELRRTLPALPALEDIISDIIDRLPRRRIRVINSEGKGPEELAGVPNFIIGGNIVGRGLTIPNLLVTYYLRKPKISQMDTMLQHARMFGYRKKLMNFTRVFLPRSLALRFYSIHRAEQELREVLPNIDALSQVPVQVVGELRATRYGVLDTGSIVTLRNGAHVFPVHPPLGLAAAKMKLIEKMLSSTFDEDIGRLTDEKHPLEETIPTREAASLCRLFDGSDWDGDGNANILEALSNEVHLRFRPMKRRRKPMQGPEMPTGALSGHELAIARARNKPTLFIMRQLLREAAWNEERFWYPTLVFPNEMSSVVYNDSTGEA